MTSTIKPITPLRQRMIDDMRMRKLSPKTQAGYIRVVKRFTMFLGRSPDTASIEDLRRYQLHLVNHGISPISLNATLTGLKFLFETTLDHPELLAKMHAVHVPHKQASAAKRRAKISRILRKRALKSFHPRLFNDRLFAGESWSDKDGCNCRNQTASFC